MTAGAGRIASTAEVVDLAVGAFVRERAARYGGKLLAAFQDGRTLTYEEADRRSERFGSGLIALGLAPGDRVGVMLHNSPECLIASFGIAKAGLQEVPLHTAQKGEGLAHILRVAGMRALIIDGAFHDRFAPLVSELARPGAVVATDRIADAGSSGPWIQFNDIANHTLDHLPAVSATQPSTILFTSGTTGLPKGVVRSHRADLLTSLRAAACMKYGAGDVLFSVFPLSHLNAKVNTLMGAMHAGASAVFYERFSASTFWESTRKHGATSATFQGAMLEILWKTREPQDRDNPVATGRAAPVPAALHRDFEEYFRIRLYETFGATETGIVSFNAERRPGSCGKPLEEHFEVAVLDPEDNILEAGQPGILAIRPRVPYAMFTSYLDMPDYTLGAFRNLWFHTGDLVVQDADGYLSFVTRKSDSIRRRGENISPWEVEQAVTQVPGVLECVAYGVPSALTEEEVMVAVVRDRSGPELTPERIVSRCEDLLPRHAVPHYVRFVEAIPKTESQRARREEFKAEGVTSDTWHRSTQGPLAS